MAVIDQYLFNPEIERALLGGLLLDCERTLAVVLMRGVKPEMFYIGRHVVAFNAILALHGRGRPVDALTIKMYLEDSGELDRAGGADYVTGHIDHMPSLGHLGGYLDEFMEHYRLRVLRDSARVVDDMIVNGAVSSDISARVITGITQSMDYYERDDAKEHLDQSLVDFENAKSGKFPGYSTFIPSIGEILGVYVPSNMYVLGARPSDGKSTWAQNETLHMAMHHKVTCAFASMEMSAKLLREMMMGALAGVSIYNARLGMYTDSSMQRMRDAADKLAGLPIHINDRRMSVEELIAWLAYVVSRHGVKFAVVDYLQLMRPTRHMRRDHSRNEQVLEWSARIKEASKRLNIVTLVLSQLSRGGDRIVNKTPAPPTLEAFRDSGGIEQDADGALLLYKEPDIDALEFFGDKDWRMEVCVAKNRIGPTGTRPVRFVRRRQVFEGVDAYEKRKDVESTPQRGVYQ